MNYYKRHIGDYIRDTAHLSLIEHGAYARLLDVYYTRENGIPHGQAARLVGARGKDELAAVELILVEFFELQGDTWIHGRCDEEIAIASAKAERNREVGRQGGRPVSKRMPAASETEPTDNPDGSNLEPTDNPSHYSTTPLHQEEEKKARKRAVVAPSLSVEHLTAKGVSEPVARDFIAIRKRKRADLTETALAGIEREAATAGYTLQDALRTSVERGWQSFKAEWVNGAGRGNSTDWRKVADRTDFGQL